MGISLIIFIFNLVRKRIDGKLYAMKAIKKKNVLDSGKIE